MSESMLTVDLPSPATVRNPSPPHFFPYRFDADSLPGASPAAPRSPTPTIPLEAWFAALYGQRYPDFVDISPARLLDERLVELWNRSIRGNRVNVGQREHGRTAVQVRKARAARMRYKLERAARLEGRRVELVNWFLVGMRDGLNGLLDPEDRLYFQQVHDGQVEACMAAVAGLGLDWNDF